MKATYIRVSTSSQNTITQEIKGVGQLYIDKISGVTPFNQRIQGSRLLSDIAIGKVKHVYVNRIDRLSRHASEIMTTIEYFKTNNCQLTVTSMGNINLFEDGKINFAFMLMVSLYSQIAEQQKEEIREKTQEGIEAAKKRGVYKGRKKNTKESDDVFKAKHKDIANCLKNGMSLNDIVQTTKKSKPTVIKLKKLLNT